jgi:hypothetical protein
MTPNNVEQMDVHTNNKQLAIVISLIWGIVYDDLNDRIEPNSFDMS